MLNGLIVKIGSETPLEILDSLLTLYGNFSSLTDKITTLHALISYIYFSIFIIFI